MLYGTVISRIEMHSHPCRDSRTRKIELGGTQPDEPRTSLYGFAITHATLSAAPVAIMAAPRPQRANVQVRVYDKNHKDYHNWDDHENQAWGIVSFGQPQETSGILEDQQEGAGAILELSPQPSR